MKRKKTNNGTSRLEIQELVNLVTALVPSETACLASSPGKISRTAVWISREVMVGFLLYRASFAASWASFSKMSLMNEFIIPMAFDDIPVSGCTYKMTTRSITVVKKYKITCLLKVVFKNINYLFKFFFFLMSKILRNLSKFQIANLVWNLDQEKKKSQTFPNSFVEK